ncbi:MAG: DAK2 domain-containing protein [Bacillota bacterium]|nr:DAK2 domain-containing protein [Bacillota bacterium]
MRELNGRGLLAATEAAAERLALHEAEVNALNVFPVPDGDTGNNMSQTIQNALREAQRSGSSLGEVARALAQGALMGARGNSGVILSQLLRGFADGLRGMERAGPQQVAAAMRRGVETAYRAVMKPVEGTILTVARRAAEAAEEAARQGAGLSRLLSRALEAARQALAETPRMLEVLRHAGVVDSGGQGLVYLLEGASERIGTGGGLGVASPPSGAAAQAVPAAALPAAEESGQAERAGGAGLAAYREEAVRQMEHPYETEFFLVAAAGPDFPRWRRELAAMGSSLVVVEGERMARVHIHTADPGRVLSWAVRQGELRDVSVVNLRLQSETYAQTAAGERAAEAGERPAPVPAVAVVAVVQGEGMERVYRSLGARRLVRAGATFNPSTEEILEAIRSVPEEAVIVLPNHRNVRMAAEQAARLAVGRRVEVVPTADMAQGIAALMNFVPDQGLEASLSAMREALASVRTGMVTRAVREATLDGVEVREGEFLALHGNELVHAGPDLEETTLALVERLAGEDARLITLIYGEGVDEGRAKALARQVEQAVPACEVQVERGDQPLYPYLVAAE